jgi:tetratricopeptide (TPR) repeat protein
MAKKYLALRDDFDMSSIMLRYSLARAEFFSGDMSSAVRTIMVCICLQPTFAEFWCLLGDMLYKTGQYSKAKAFYWNAMTIGKRRRSSDEGLVEIKKYKDYPSRMIESIKEIESKSEIISQKR